MGGNKTTNNRAPTLRLKGNSSSKEEPQLKEILAVYSDGDKKNIFVFPANEVKKISLAHPINRTYYTHVKCTINTITYVFIKKWMKPQSLPCTNVS